MLNTQGNQQLRNTLQQIIDNNREGKVSIQITLIESLSTILPHTIRLEEEAKLNNDKSWQYNCFTYAFRLWESPEFVDINEHFSFLLPNSSFVSYLIAGHLTQTVQDDVKDDDYIIYFLNDEPQHAGRIRKDKIVSKWGMYHLWEHGIWEIPIQYGDRVCFFEQISIEECVSAFKTWVDADDMVAYK